MNTLIKPILNPLAHSRSLLHVVADLQVANKRKLTLVYCSTSKEGTQPPKEGDERKQELLARMAQLQAQKVRLTSFLDERSAYLTKFAEEADVEFDAIAEDTLKGLDEASARIMENLESRMQAMEEDANLTREEIEWNERVLQEFEDQMEKGRNEGMFFKSLKTTPNKEATKRPGAKEEVRKLKEVTKGSTKSGIRRNVYLALGGLLIVTIACAVTSSPAELDWRRIAVLTAILLALIAQFLYEQSIPSETTKEEKK